jgi:DNA/RNA-binding domain of Phe-tRNA-synthetase-like protein
MQEPIISGAWRTAWPGSSIGILAVRNTAHSTGQAELDVRKETLEECLRAHYAGYDRVMLKALPIMSAYGEYYRKFRKTYHVQLQLESIVLKGRSIPCDAAPVQAMYMAELKNLLLTAGHDLDKVQPPIRVDISDGTERYIRINGVEQQLKQDDMFIADAQGVLSSVIYGPDYRTRISPDTGRVLFTVYAPIGVDDKALYAHLRDIQDNILLACPEVQVELLSTYR